jgi:tRNA(Phe) wybutosine-synthesizing methylase Tyw3
MTKYYIGSIIQEHILKLNASQKKMNRLQAKIEELLRTGSHKFDKQ